MEEIGLDLYIIQHNGTEPTEDVGFIIEGVQVLQVLRDLANACTGLLGLICSFNLSYSENQRYTFEFLQKVLVDFLQSAGP